MTVDVTGVAVAFISVAIPTIGSVFAAWLASHIKDKAAAEVVSDAVKNSLGAVQQAATSEIQALHPQISGVPAVLQPGVQYVLDQAGPEAQRLGITPVAIAQKIEAKIGLANIATNLAVTASPMPVVAPPLDAVPKALAPA